MIQPTTPSPQKPRIRWRWAILIAVCVTPFVMVVLLVGLYFVARQQQIEALAQVQVGRHALMQARQLEEATRVSTTEAIATHPVVPATPKKQAHVVRVQVDFDDFESRTADAITVESSNQSNSGSRLMVPSEVFAPITAKINGRMVTRVPSSIRIVEAGPPSTLGMGMGGAAMGGMPGGGILMVPSSAIGGGFPSPEVRIISDHPSISLAEVWWQNAILTPVRVLGDFPQATVGDKLRVVTSVGGAPTSTLTVLGTDETLHVANGGRFEHLLKLTECAGPLGSMLCNQAGDPVGQIAFTIPGKLTYSYAVPMDRIFAVLDKNRTEAIDATPMIGTDSITKTPEAIGRDLTLTDGPSNSLPTVNIDTEPQKPPLPPVLADPSLPADTSQLSVRIPDGERRIYRVQGSASDVAETIRSLYGTESKVAVDRGSRSVIVIASLAVQEKISEAISEMNRGAREVMAEQAKQAELEKTQQDALTAEQRLELLMQREQAAEKEAAEEELHRQNPKRTRIVKVDGRDPKEVSKILSTLFGQKADIAIDDRTGSVLITINRATTWSEVQFLLSEIEATAKRLAAETPLATTTTSTELTRANLLTNATPGAIDLPSGDQSVADLDREAKELALQLRTAAPAEQAAVRAKLEQQLDRQFRQRQTLRKQEIDDLSSRIEKLRATQSRRETNRTEIIRRHLNELLDPNNDLRWDESRNSTREIVAPPEQLVVKETVSESTPTASIESTFDGVPYSQWRKMLETERKPAKLVTAIEACSRLASPADAHQIVGAIIKATFFETDNSDERRDVWTAALNALERMPSDSVIDEALASLNLPDVTSYGRAFQGIFFARSVLMSSLKKAVVARDQEIVAALIKATQQGKDDRDWLLAGASSIWGHSNRELKDFAGLEPLVRQRIDTPPPVSSFYFGDSWMFVAEALVKKNPETPGLAVQLMKYAPQERAFLDMTALVGQMGKHAEPAVDTIIEQFLVEWKKIEVESTKPAGGPRRFQSGRNELSKRAIRLIHLLGQIGTGTQAARLLKELSLMGNIPAGEDPEMSGVLREAQQAIDIFSDVPAEDGPAILRDESLIHGVWQVQSTNFKPTTRTEAWIKSDGVAWVERRNGQSFGDRIDGEYIGRRMELESTKSPKEIVFRASPESDPGIIRLGLYELTETSLKIYLAPLGKPKPSEIVTEATAIPEGYLLIELRRSLPPKERR